MDKKAEKLYKAVLENLIKESAVTSAVVQLKNKGKLSISMIYPISTLLIVVGVSFLFKLWWLFLPIAFIYFLIDWKIRYNKVVRILPEHVTFLIDGLLASNNERLLEVAEDLDIKTKNNIYNEEDIKVKTKEIDFLTVTCVILEKLKKDEYYKITKDNG